MISLAERRSQLIKLLDALVGLIGILDNDPNCQWLRHFRSCHSEGQRLLEDFSQEDLNVLSARVNSVYGGMGSFNDYVPPGRESKGRHIIDPNFRKLSKFSGLVYECAFKLRVVGERDA